MFQNEQQVKNKTEDQKVTIDKNIDFWLWFLWILQEARIVDTNYSVKGSYVWLDWGYKLFKKIYAFAQEAYIQSGHNQMQFPTLIKESTFLKETDFIRNFENEVFWVDREGSKKLAKGERLALRPTSELIIYPMFARWIRSWRDMPLKVFQNVSIFRCETNDTRPLIRNRETIGFIEGHSAFQSKKEALAFLETIGKTYSILFEKLGIPVKLIEVPKWDRFVGSTKTIDGYVILPGSKSMELFTTAYLGTTFSKIFNIEYLDHHKKKQFTHLLCYGPSIDRILATIIAYYGDNKGLVLLPDISPIDMIIIPIFNRKNKSTIMQYSNEIKKQLISFGFKVEIDDNELTTPGMKFYQSERLGIPLRIEIGQKEFANNKLTITRRDTLQKETLNWQSQSIQAQILKTQKTMDDSMRKKALLTYQESIIDFSDKENLELLLEDTKLIQNNMYLISWCGSESCAEAIEQQTKFTILGYDYQLKHKKKKKCLYCSSFGFISVLAKRY
ncbi:MAG: proline--tRNA ligase [Asgard group archaeon]|nr:proline--tRNA ligase [Asgard group archaeon]